MGPDPSPSRDASTADPTVVAHENGQLAYTEYGDPDGDPVVLFHGTPGSRLLGALFETMAEEQGVRLLAVDRPGYGNSEPWPTRSITDAGTYVSAMLDDADIETATLLAFSGGSPQAIATAATHGGRVDRVKIVSGATPPSVSEDTPTVQQVLATLATRTPSLLGGLLRGQAWLAERLDPEIVVSQYRADEPAEPLSDETAELIKADFLEAISHSRRGTVTELRANAGVWGIDFDQLATPVELRHGGRDTNVPLADARRFASTLPDSDLTVYDDADHLGALLRSVPEIFEKATTRSS
ncbi:alpha/beta fold hydrolase [Halonotius roseus]|uniref:Alpha/beta hydrolase n=1 Tax=Halonotius roseus TaxID=2511997 RepID=A0A544QMI0_9EURY|nr:alpha/beta hydrolase [Halonotius roseus]TQQ80084.1 alpha/beta hydrolase [Halonotius roseus]